MTSCRGKKKTNKKQHLLILTYVVLCVNIGIETTKNNKSGRIVKDLSKIKEELRNAKRIRIEKTDV